MFLIVLGLVVGGFYSFFIIYHSGYITGRQELLCAQSGGQYNRLIGFTDQCVKMVAEPIVIPIDAGN
jgi:hypothetical protein